MTKYTIYKISNDEGDAYFGSTTRTVEQRLLQHRYDMARHLRGQGGFLSSFLVLAGSNPTIKAVAEIESNDIEEVRKLERFYIENFHCKNMRYPSRTIKEWKGIQNTCGCGGKYVNDQKARHFKSKKHSSWVDSQSTNQHES